MNDKAVLKRQLESMAERLMAEVGKIGVEPLVMDYDNGGGQSGIRENPFYPAYEKLLSAYTKALAAYESIAGGKDADIRSLDSIRAKLKVAK